MAKKLVKKAATAASKKTSRPAKPARAARHVVKAAKVKAPVAKASAAKGLSSKVAARAPLNGKPQVVAAPKPGKAAKVASTTKVAGPAKLNPTATKSHAATKTVAEKSTGKPIAITIKPEAVKASSGRPMLLQGPIAVRPMGKKATLIITPDKPKPKVLKKRLPASDEPKFVIVQPPTKAVATSERAAKNKAGFNQKDLDFFRDLLLAKRRELVGDMSSMEREALRENSTDLSNLPVHMADQGTDAYEQEFTLHLVEKDRTLLRELNDALAKIQNGTYGICEGTGLPISKPRLEAQPWARHSIEHARALEKRQGMFRR